MSTNSLPLCQMPMRTHLKKCASLKKIATFNNRELLYAKDKGHRHAEEQAPYETPMLPASSFPMQTASSGMPGKLGSIEQQQPPQQATTSNTQVSLRQCSSRCRHTCNLATRYHGANMPLLAIQSLSVQSHQQHPERGNKNSGRGRGAEDRTVVSSLDVSLQDREKTAHNLRRALQNAGHVKYAISIK